MVISFRTTEEEGLRIKRFAEDRNMKTSELAREALNRYISEAEAELRRADEERERSERIARTLKRLEEFDGFLADTPLAKMGDEEIRDLWKNRDA